MPNIDDMFQSQYISYRDLELNKLYTGTIHSVQIEAARGKAGVGGNPGFQGRPGQAIEADWIMWFAEFPKPYKLRPAKARILAAIFNEKVTENWGGRVVQFYRGTTTIGNDVKESINLDEMGTRMLAAKPIAAATPNKLLDLAKARVNIPRAAVDRFCKQLGEKKKSWTDFIGWMKSTCPDGHGMICGCDLDTISGAVLPAMGVYLKSFDAPAAPLAVVDQADAQPPEITENDIPF